jgi:hypothetical protein
MPKANPLVQISKRLASLQAKSSKMNEEITALVATVADELKKLAAAPAPVPAKAGAKPAAGAPKKAPVAKAKAPAAKKLPKVAKK